MEGKSAPPVMIPMSRSSRDYRASKNPKVSSEDTSSASAAPKKSQIRASGSPTRSTQATKKAKTGGSTLAEQNRLAHAIEPSTGRRDSANQPLRPATSRSKRVADANGDVTLDTLRPSKKSKISYSLKTGEASVEDNDSLIRKNLKTDGVRKKQTSGTATPSRTPEATPSDNALNALKLPKSGAGSAGSTSHSEETNAGKGSVSQISEGAVNVVGCSEPPELTEQRSLRPRPKPPVSKKVVKRTRFHEVSLGDLDGPRIVGRRIKVFWPLDKKWYYGSVKAYNGVKKQHKIIYDDHDEEWLKLQKESFRLEVLSGDAFGFAAPSTDLADLADLVAIAECDESSKHRGDVVDGCTSASDDKPSAERTGVRRSKAGRENERKRKSEWTGEEKKNLDGASEQRKKKAGRGSEKKKLEGDSEPKKKKEGGGDRGKKTDATKGAGRKKGDAKQRATKGEKLGRGNAKRAVLEVYERRKKRAQGVGTSGPTDHKGKSIAPDGLSERRKRTGKESSRKGSTSQARTRRSAAEAAEGKKTARRGIRDNDRLFASIKSPSVVLRRKVAEGKRAKESKPLVSTPDEGREENPEDEEMVFLHPQGTDAGPLHMISDHGEERGEAAVGLIPSLPSNYEQQFDRSPRTLTADVSDEDDAGCEEPDSPATVPDMASDDKATSEDCRHELPPASEPVPRELSIVRDDAVGAVCGEQSAGRQEVVLQRETSEVFSLAGESVRSAECLDQYVEEVQLTGNDSGGSALQAVESRVEFPPSILDESSNQEVLRSAFPPVTVPTSQMKHPPDKVYVRVRHKIHKVYRRETHQSSKVQKKGVQDEGSGACAPVVEPVVQQLSASSCVISALHVMLNGPLYFGMGLEGPLYLSSLRIAGLGRWSRLRDGTLQLGTYFGFPGVVSLLRVSRRLLHFFLTTITQSKTVVGFSLDAVEDNAESCRSDAGLGEATECNFAAVVSPGRTLTRPGPRFLSRKTGRPGPHRRRRMIKSFHPYLNHPLTDSKRLSFHRSSVRGPGGIDRSFQRRFTLGWRNSHPKIGHSMVRVVTPLTTDIQELPFPWGEGGHLPACREISSGNCPSRSSGAGIVPFSRRILLHSHFKQISSASSLLSNRRGSVPNALLDAVRRERWMVKFPVASVSGESVWHNPQGWVCREVGCYFGRRSLLSLLRVSADDLCIGCSFSSSSSSSWDDGWQLAVILAVLRDIYEFCKDSGFSVSYISGRDCKDLVRELISKLLADRAIGFCLSRVCGFKVLADLREIADYYDGFRRRREIGDVAYELTQLLRSRSFDRMAESWGNGSSAEVAPVLVTNVDGMCNGLWDRQNHQDNLEYNGATSARYSQEIVVEDSDRSILSGEEYATTTRRALWSSGSIPRSLLSPEEMSVCASTLSRAIRRPQLLPSSPSYVKAYSREVPAVEGTALRVGRGSVLRRMSTVFVVLDEASYASAGPVLLFTSSARRLPDVYPRTSMRRCTDLGTYYGLPSIFSFLRISKDFWRRIFQRPKEVEEVSSVCAINSVPIVDEEPHAGLFSQWPELTGVDNVEDEGLSELEDRLEPAPSSKVGESFEGKESKENSTGEEFDSTRTSAESLLPSIEGCRTGKGIKRGFGSISDNVGDTSGAEPESPVGGDTLDGRPYSKRTRAEIENSDAAAITDNGFEISSPSSDVDGNGCRVPPPAAEQKIEEASLPRVNILKLRRCPTNKGLWRVAGNSCAPPQDKSMSGRALEVRDSGDGAESVTPVFEMSRKRGLNHCSEALPPGRNDPSGNSVLTSTFSSNLTDCSPSPFEQDIIDVNANKAFSLDSKPEEVWFDCGMTYINEVTDGLEPRKRRRKGPSPPTHSDDVETVSEHSLRRSTDSGRVPCMANLLIIKSDRCLRETGAVVELLSGHGNTWMLSVSLNGGSKFAYKADQPVATGTSNKFTHAMMWRGGKDWSLEFVDRKQWQLFKDLHDECFQRSVRAATVRHIPIPGVKQIQETPRTGMRFVRPYAKYIRQTDGEVEAALTSSRVIYDMDSEDEDWLNQANTEKVTSRGTRSRPRIEEDTLERVIDKLERISFVQPQQEPLLTCEVAAEVCQTLASQEALRAIHGYWYDKRKRRGMALVRHFQPAPWEQYQKQLEDWQSKVNQLQQQSPTANKQQLQSMCKRPPMFAFCLRPRGLENRNKMQKQRSQRKQGLGGSSSRQWTLAGPASDFFLDSPSKRPAHLESSGGSFYGSRKYARQRMVEEPLNFAEPIPVDLTDSFNASACGEGFTSSGGAEQVIPTGAGATFSQVDSSPVTRTERTPTARPHNKKKAGRKARKMRLLASAEESRRKRQLRAQQGHVKERFLNMVHSPHSLSEFGQPTIDTPSTSTLSFPQTDSEEVDLEAIAMAKAAAAKLARETATAKRARAQALYAVADAAMHKAVAAVIAADAIHASERAMEKAAAMLGQEVESPEQTGEVPVKDEGSRTRLRTSAAEGGTSFGSWRRALHSASKNANHLLSKGTSSKQGLLPDTDDPLLPVASWSQELGAGLGTRLLQTGEVSPQRQRYSPVVDGLNKSPTRGVVNLGRTRGESMMAMLTR